VEVSSTPVALAEAPADRGRGERVRTSPLVKRLAEQYGINLAEVPGTGIGGRVSKQDILSFIEQKEKEPQEAPHLAPTGAFERPAAGAPPAPPRAASAPAAPQLPPQSSPRQPGANEEMVPVSPLRKMIAERMVLSKFTIPHATTMSDIDMTRVVRYREAHKDEFRQREGLPLSYVAFVIKATVEALKQFPYVNAEWAGDNIILKKDININVAVDAPEGLTTPVIHHADAMSLAGLSRAIYDLAMRARDKKLKVEDMQGGTFTVNNTGALGSVSGVSIINYPQAGILSAGAIVKKPVVVEVDGEDVFAVRHIMNLSFSFDHRLLDGGSATSFVNEVQKTLESWPQDYPIY
jgi:2-oxoisovalerate dehydrogenase E2 component (dihydrolipoyl transacylase)